MLPLVGIAALMVLGFVIWVTALTYEAPVKSDTARDRALARERRRLHRKQRRRRAQQASSGVLRGVRASVVELGTWAIALAHKWWPRLRHHAGRSRASVVELGTWAIALAHKWWPRLRHHAGRSRASVVELGRSAIALAHKWWPRLRHHARQSRARWLSLESTTGPLIAVGAASVIVAYLVVTFA